MPSISVVIPALNAEKTLGLCLQAIVSQEVMPFEIIVVDNSSKDDTIKVAQQFSNVKIEVCTKRSAACARNHGWRIARGEYIAFVDADVILEKNWIKEILISFNDKKIIATQSRIVPFKAKSNPRYLDLYRYERKRYKTSGSFIDFDFEKKQLIINTAACAYRKETLVNLNGFEEKLKRLEDLDLSVKACYLGSAKETRNTHGEVFFTGSVFSYLLRSYRDGRGSIDFMVLWGIKENRSRYKPSTAKFLLFDLVVFFIYFLGQFRGGSIDKDSKPHSLLHVKLIQKIQTFN